MTIVWLHKPIGWTPKTCIDEYRSITGEKGKIAFAGRLDPMAYGLLPIIINEDRNTAAALESTDKTYQFKVIMGLQTDTYDILGLITHVHKFNIFDDTLFQELVHKCSIITTQEYPPYSSKTVTDERTGKKVALWKLTTQGIKVPLPEHAVEIKYIKLLYQNVISTGDLLSTIISRIDSLPSSCNMRQEKILSMWKSHCSDLPHRKYQLITCEASVSSGTYIRSIANSMGGVCYDINRIRHGNKTLTFPINEFQFAIL